MQQVAAASQASPLHSNRGELGLNPKPGHFKPFEYFDHMGTERSLSVCGEDFSRSGVLGKDPVKCVVKIAKNVNSFFAGGFTIYLKHSGKSKSQVASH
jgi:hypothetical protein